MKLQDYMTITSSTSAYTTTEGRTASSASFDSVMDNATQRLASKVAKCSLDSTASTTNLESDSDVMKQLAQIQAAIEEANARNGYVPASAESNTSGTSIGQAATSVCDVYNEGKLCCSDELNAYFLEASQTYGVDVKLLKAVAFVESSFRANVTSKCGAMGVMQLMPSTAKQYGVEDPYDAYQNIMGGAKLIAAHLKRYDGDIELTLAAYNAGAGNVKKAGGVPSYTEGYINKVLKYYNA